MSNFKDFDAARAEAQEEPIEFQIGGEQFAVQLPLPATCLLDLAAATSGAIEDDATPQQQMAMVMGYRSFLEAVLGGEWERFEKVITTARIGVDMLMAVTEYIVEESSGRPFAVPSSSPSQPSSTGQPSTAGYVSGGSTRPEVAEEG